ncbi:MAG TPA: polysaccharide biosynthesis C-terminal domain-containing protein, partial [Bacteroidales bacterium]|nr:polysaccharide biosynthesis C-terminal domain-containing protein [Bacteroidales bacterium]
LVTFLLLSPVIFRVKLMPDIVLLKRMLNYSWPLLILGVAGILNETFGRIILKHLVPTDLDPMAQLGIYGASYKVAVFMTLFIQTYRYAAEPFFFEQMKSENAPKIYAQTMNYFVMFGAVIFLSISLFLDFSILFVGYQFREGAPAIPILLLANLFLGIFYNLSVWFKIKDKTKHGAAISCTGVIVTIILNILLVPLLGFIGSAWATLACYFVIMVVSYLTGQRHYPVPYQITRLFAIVAIAVTLFIADTHLFSQYTEYENFRKIGLLAGFVFYITISDRIIRGKLLSILKTRKG